MKYRMTKQEIIEQKIDSLSDTNMGKELVAALALSARLSIAKTTSKMIVDFSKSLGFTNHEDTAWKILKYVYPENPAYWQLQDKRFNKMVNDSAWLQWNYNENKRMEANL